MKKMFETEGSDDDFDWRMQALGVDETVDF